MGRIVLRLLAVCVGQMLLTVPVAVDVPLWVRIVVGVPGLFLIAWGMVGRWTEANV